MQPPELPVLYCDEYLVAVHKPSGLLVHRTGLNRSDRYFALQLLRDKLGSRVYPLHRLDRPTSGVLLFARDSESASIVAEQFRNNRIEKNYSALVRGWIESPGSIDYPLKSIHEGRLDALAKPALTLYSPLRSYEVPRTVGRYETARYSLLRLTPHNGRRHQLRRHLKHVFHPVIGDINYGDGRHNVFFRDFFDSHRLLLASTHLTLSHPGTHEKITIESPPDSSFQVVVDQLEQFRIA